MRQLMLLGLWAALSLFAFGQVTQSTDGQKPVTVTKADAATAGLPSEATVESFLKYMFGYDSSLEWKILAIEPSPEPKVAELIIGLRTPEGSQTMRLFVMPDQQWAIAGEMMNFGAQPFARNSAEFAAKAHGPSRGPADSDITIVEFSDLECPACKAAQPVIDRLWNDFPNAHFIFQNFPLERIHPWAFKAAEYADCLAREKPDAFWKFLALDYQNQQSVTAENVDQQMKDFATQAGADAGAVAACVAEPATAARVRESLDLGSAVDVNGTPALFVNGRAIGSFSSLPYDILKKLVQGTPK